MNREILKMNFKYNCYYKYLKLENLNLIFFYLKWRVKINNKLSIIIYNKLYNNNNNNKNII